MQDIILEQLLEEAGRQLPVCYKKSRKEEYKDRIKKMIGKPTVSADPMFWPAGLLAIALTDFLSDNRAVEKESGFSAKLLYIVQRHFDDWITEGCKLFQIDDALSGCALLALYRHTNLERYRQGAEKIAEYLKTACQCSGDHAGSIPYRPAHKNGHIYVDGAGMTGAFLIRYGSMFQDETCIKSGVLQLQNMLLYGMCEKQGLPYQGYVYEKKIKYGIIGWGRSVGWLMTGFEAVLDCLPAENEAFEQLLPSYRNLAERCIRYQREQGYYSWQLEAMEGPVDTSATAMIAKGILSGIRRGVWESKEQTEVMKMSVTRAAEAILLSVKEGQIYDCSGECGGFSCYPQNYGAYPWSLGSGISLLIGINAIVK